MTIPTKKHLFHANSRCLELDHVENISVTINMADVSILTVISVYISPVSSMVGDLDLLLAGNAKIISHLGTSAALFEEWYVVTAPTEPVHFSVESRLGEMFLTYSA